jgi:hypothetical protein
MIGGYVKPPTPELLNGVPIQDLIGQFGLARYFRNHSGTFVFERDYGRQFLAECMDVWSKELSLRSRRPSEFPTDELAFGVVAARRGMAAIRDPSPVYWREQPHDPWPHKWKSLWHLHYGPSQRTMRRLMAEVAVRRCRAGLSPLSIGHWLRKTNRMGRSVGWQSMLQNWDVKLHAAWGAHRRHRKGVAAVGGPPIPDASFREYEHPLPHRAGTQTRGLDWKWGDATRLKPSTQPSNLLLHRTRRRQIIATPHIELAIRERWSDAEMPVALAIHCWPQAPLGLCMSVGWRDSERPTLAIDLRGPLPEHQDAVLCMRFRGRQAKELNSAVSLLANLRASLVSDGVLRNSVTAIGIGGDYLAGLSVDQPSRTVDHEFFLRSQQWPAKHDELFLEFRLAVAGLARSDVGAEIELSCFYLGQNPDESAFGGRPGTPVLAPPEAGIGP